MNKETKIYKQIFTLRKGGENGEKYFFTIGNMMLSSKLHDTEEEAFEELENINLESIARMLVAVMETCNELINTRIKYIKK